MITLAKAKAWATTHFLVQVSLTIITNDRHLRSSLTIVVYSRNMFIVLARSVVHLQLARSTADEFRRTRKAITSQGFEQFVAVNYDRSIISYNSNIMGASMKYFKNALAYLDTTISYNNKLLETIAIKIMIFLFFYNLVIILMVVVLYHISGQAFIS